MLSFLKSLGCCPNLPVEDDITIAEVVLTLTDDNSRNSQCQDEVKSEHLRPPAWTFRGQGLCKPEASN